MKIGDLLYSTSVISPSTQKKAIEPKQDQSYLDYQNQNSFNQEQSSHNKKRVLQNHQKFFLFNDTKTLKDENISTQELISKMRSLLQTPATSDLLESFDELAGSDRLKFSSSTDNLGDNTDIVINTDQSLLGVTTTLIHELKHYNDLNDTALQLDQSTNSLALEIRAFAKEFEFMKSNNLLEESSYLSLPDKIKDIYQSAYEIESNSTPTNEAKNHMIDLLETIGYERNGLIQREIISSNEVELNRKIGTHNLDSLFFQSKFNS